MNPKSLYVADIALLKTIQLHPDSRIIDLWMPCGGGLWNKFLRSSGLVKRGHLTIVNSKSRFTDAIHVLNFCGYLRSDMPHYTISSVGEALFYTLSPRPCEWPIFLPLTKDGERLWDAVTYFTKR